MNHAAQGQHPAGRRPARQAPQLRGHPWPAGRESDAGELRATEALEHLLRTDIAVRRWSTSACLTSTASSWRPMIREHPRHQRAAIIFVSAVHMIGHRPRARLRSAERVDYVSVPIVPEILRAQRQRVRRPLPQDRASSSGLNRELEHRVEDRTGRAPRCARSAAGVARLALRERRITARTSSWRCSRTSCETLWPRFATRSRSSASADQGTEAALELRGDRAPARRS